MAIENIVLKDRQGNPITHNEVQHLRAITDDGAERIYTDMSTLSVYFATYDDGTKKYTIRGQWFCVGGNGYALSSATAEQASTYDPLYLIFTTKALSTNQAYFASELGGI